MLFISAVLLDAKQALGFISQAKIKELGRTDANPVEMIPDPLPISIRNYLKSDYLMY